MKALVIQISDSHCHNGPSFNEIGKITMPVSKEYCDRFGYDFLPLDYNPDPSRQISWGRSFLIKKHLKDYDWIWAIDADAMIMNHSIKLDYVVDNNYSVIVGAGQNKSVDHINTGSILWKNSYFSQLLLERMFADGEFANKGFWEQSTLIKLLKQDQFLSSGVKIVDLREFNSHYHCWFGDQNYQHGDLAVHLAGSDNSFRCETLRRLSDYVIRPTANIQSVIPIIR